MAWRSGGDTNDEMCDQLHRNGIITKPAVIEAFRAVPRGFFVPHDAQESAYHDAPLRHGRVHLSAPHIYGAVAEALEMHRGMSFLNIGSGTGYFSTIAAVIGGATSLNHGIELDEACFHFCLERTSSFKTQRAATGIGDDIADVNVVHGNVFDMEELLEGAMFGRCESYDRIYVGAACPASLKDKLLRSLTLGGVLVAPVGDELLKVRRVDVLDDANYATPPHSRRNSVSSTSSMGSASAAEFGGDLDEDEEARANFAASFSIALLSGVRFVELTPSSSETSSSSSNQPQAFGQDQRSRSSSVSSEATSRSDSSMECARPVVKRRARLPTALWSPETHAVFPTPFKRSAFALMVWTTSARFSESLPGRLPRALWLEVLSFTSRSWFTPPPSEVERLRLRLAKEEEAREEAEQAAREATRARRMAERECERYRSLARQLEQRLSSYAVHGQSTGQSTSSSSLTGGGWLGHFFGGLTHHRNNYEEDVEEVAEDDDNEEEEDDDNAGSEDDDDEDDDNWDAGEVRDDDSDEHLTMASTSDSAGEHDDPDQQEATSGADIRVAETHMPT